MKSTNTQIVRRWFDEVWNKGKEATIDELFDRDGISHGLRDGGVVRGPEEFKSFVREIRSAFPDIAIKIDEVIESQENVAVRWSAEMTHSGNFAGVKPTNKHVRIAGVAISRIEGGKIVEGWNVWEQDRLMSQIRGT